MGNLRGDIFHGGYFLREEDIFGGGRYSFLGGGIYQGDKHRGSKHRGRG